MIVSRERRGGLRRWTVLLLILMLMPAGLMGQRKGARGVQELWVDSFQDQLLNPFSLYEIQRMAKAAPDECYYGIGDPRNHYDPQYGNFPVSCAGGKPKVNQGYVWGLTDAGDHLWFGTVTNAHILVLSELFGFLGIPLPAVETDSWVAEFDSSQYASPYPPEYGDWRPPRIFTFDMRTETLSEQTPTVDLLINNTAGIRAAGALDDVVLMAGPSQVLPTGGGINMFAYNAHTFEYIGSMHFPEYNDIRQFVVADGVLYAGVGNTAGGGSVLRWRGTLSDPFLFESVGLLDANAANLAVYGNRIFATTWSVPLGGLGGSVFSGLYRGPDATGGLTSADAGSWDKVWDASMYEPYDLAAATTVGGALASYDGWLYWGTMHVPLMTLLAHFQVYGIPDDVEAFVTDFLGTHRSISLFRGRDLGEATEEIEVLYGMSSFPVYTPDNPLDPQGGGSWSVEPNRMGGAIPSYGLSGFGNFFNAYTWSMSVFEEELFVGTFDWSYLVTDLLDWAAAFFGISFQDPALLDVALQAIPVFHGADLWRFADSDSPALPENHNGVGNHTNYGIRNMVAVEASGIPKNKSDVPDGDALYLGMANPMNLLTDQADDVPEGGWELIKLTKGAETVTDEVLRFWIDQLRAMCDEPFSAYPPTVIAKALPDEYFYGVGDANNSYDPQYHNLPLAGPEENLKVNQGYVWGLASGGENLWFGTVSNMPALALGSLLGALGSTPPPVETRSMVAEYGASRYVPPVAMPAGMEDWRPPRIFVYHTATNQLVERTPADPLIHSTAGIRAVGILGEMVMVGGPTSLLPGGAGINLFAFDNTTGDFLGSCTLSDYYDIRMFEVVDGALYAGVGCTAGGGKVLRWTGSPGDPFLFESVGDLDADVAYLGSHDGRLFASTWSVPLVTGPVPESGLWMSPEIPGGGLTAAHAGGWSKVWIPSDYDPFDVTAMTTFGGALASYDGYMYWGTMHVPILGLIAHLSEYGGPEDAEDALGAFLGTHRVISVFRGRNFGQADEEIELLYGMPLLPVFVPADPADPQAGGEWEIQPNVMGAEPLYGLSGFYNFFNTYTWSMEVFNGELFVGTFDWSYLFTDLMDWIPGALDFPFQELNILGGFFQQIPCFHGADLWRFPSSSSEAVAESFHGVGNHANYGIRNMVSVGAPSVLKTGNGIGGALYLGTANPMNRLTDTADDLPQGGWELIRLGDPPADDSDGDGAQDSLEGDGDRDGDGTSNDEDYDPTGYFYNTEDGRIITGGEISVTGPGSVTIAQDGSGGYYQWTTDGTPGIYQMHITVPYGWQLDPGCPAGIGPFDPTGGPNPTVLGAGEVGATGFLESKECGNNVWYTTFDLWPNDPFVFNNNIPIHQIIDYGDAPDPLSGTAGEYPTLLANDGARHVTSAELYIGTTVDGELNGKPGADAAGDDNDSTDDEDGVAAASLTQYKGLPVSIPVTVHNSTGNQAYLSGWIDYDADGRFEDSEKAEAVVVDGATQALLNFPVPPPGGGIVATYGRFRLASDPTHVEKPYGQALGGEVEDYPMTLLPVMVELLSPNGGGLYGGGQVVPITWSCTPSGVGTVTLKYSTDGGQTFPDVIVEGTPNDGSYAWRLPYTTSHRVRVKVEVHGSLLGEDASDTNFTIDSDPPQVILYTPNGGEVWESGTCREITWLATDMYYGLAPRPIQLSLSTDGGQTFITHIIASDELNDGVYRWCIPPDLNTTRAMVKIKATDRVGNATCDESDSLFAIVPARIEITGPNGGELLKGGSEVPVTWNTYAPAGTVSLWYTLNDGASFTPIASGEDNDGIYPWTVPGIDTDNLVLRAVLSMGGKDAEDWSDGAVSVDNTAPEVTLTAPDGGEDIPAGSVFDITWTAADPVGLKDDPITILLSVDGGATYPHLVAEGETNDGVFSWNVDASLNTTTARIRVSAEDRAGWTGTDDSDADFEVHTTTLALSAPVGGEVWQGGTEHAVRWASNEPGGAITLSYSADGGGSYPHLIAEGEANDGEYLWRVPVLNSRDLRLKVRLSAGADAEVTSRENFTVDSEAPNVHLLSLNDGARYEAGTPVEIRWEAMDNLGVREEGIALEYTADGGASYTEIAAGRSPEEAYTWVIPPDLNTDRAKLRIHLTDRAGFSATDHTDQLFSVEPLRVLLNRPAGGELWQGKTYQEIAWTSNFDVGVVSLYYSTDGGASYPHPIAEDEANDGAYLWKVPEINSSHVRVRVVLTNRTTAEDASGNDFAIDYSAPLVSVLYPNGSESIEATDPLEVRWSASDHFALAENAVTIRYSTDGGETYPNVLAENAAYDSIFTWSTPGDLFCEMVRVRVEVAGTSGLTGRDASDANFRLMNPAPFVSRLPDTTVAGDRLLTLPLNGYVYDKNNRDIELTWTYMTDGPGFDMRIDNDVNVLRGFAEEGFSGTVSVTLKATDPYGASGEGTMVVTVEGTATDVEPMAAVPAEYVLHQNYPNPFNPETRIDYEIPEDAAVHLAVYDITGRPVRTLVDGRVSAGRKEAVWDGTDESGNLVSTGVYLFVMRTRDRVFITKAAFMK